MSKVFEDKACAEFLLQIILQRHDLKVQSAQGQYDIKNLQGRSIRLDILAVDTNNRSYNIEIQRSDRGASAKRARYNSSLIDANITEAGDKYDALTETYVIFITENDVLKAGLPIYHIDHIIQETGEPFGDEAHIIYVNSQSQYHQLCWWFVFALPGHIAFPPEGGLTNHSFSYWLPLKSGSFLLF